MNIALGGTRRLPPWRELASEQLVETLRAWPALIGSPEEIVAQIKAFDAAGMSEISMQWVAPKDIEGLEILAAEVLPRVASVPP
jgi:alkanesulfonate monooxygenase SsuD/methylene tetrahydromethanopterin reductase-like flavin-dependent oxidoreductase (luciferase family)